MTLSAFEQQLIQCLAPLSPGCVVLAGVPDPLSLPAAATLFLHIDGLEPQPSSGESPEQRRQPATASLLTPLTIPRTGVPVSVPLPTRDHATYPRLVEVCTPEGRLLPIPDACALDASGTHLQCRLPPAADTVWLRWEGDQSANGYRESCDARLALRLAACAPEAATAEALLLDALARLLQNMHQRDLIFLHPTLPPKPPAATSAPFLLQLRQPLPVLGPLRRDPPTAAAVACCRLRLWLQGHLEWALLQPDAPQEARIRSVELTPRDSHVLGGSGG
jgi:hypothetical protein